MRLKFCVDLSYGNYSTFDVDYLIIMDSIIHPNVDLKLKQTKLIQLVTLSSVDNYVYDYMCINHESLAKSLHTLIIFYNAYLYSPYLVTLN